MHDAAFSFLQGAAPATSAGLRVLEIGSRDINGSPRSLFAGADYTGIDVRAGRGVDEVIDAVDFDGKGAFDVVVCAEVLEHADDPPAVLASAWRALKGGGLLILTAAGPERIPHSGVDGGPLRPDEAYANIDPADLTAWLQAAGFAAIDVRHNGVAGDVYATAAKPKDAPAPGAKGKKQ